MDSKQLATPDNAADKTIQLAISGNRLVSILNALDAAMHETGRYRLEGDSVVASSEWYATLRETTEAIRDELSRQRMTERATHCVDGFEFPDSESNQTGDGKYPPFRIFDIAAQTYLPGSYQTRQEAATALALLQGSRHVKT